MSGQDPYETNQPPGDEQSAPSEPPTTQAPAGEQPEPPTTAEPVGGQAPSGWTAASPGAGSSSAATPGGGTPGGQAPGTEANTGSYPAAGYAGAGYGGGGYAAGEYAGAGYPPGGPYAPSTYAYGAPQPRTDDKAVWALVSSIAGFVLCPIVLHVVGWVLANQSLRAIRESRGALSGDGVAKTAKVLGIVGVVLYSIGLVVAILFFAVAIPLGIFAASTSTSSLDISSETVTPTSLAEIDGESFTHTAGELTYDLSELDFAGRAADMSVTLGAGTLTIEVPADVTVNLDAEVGAGELEAFGERTDGVGLSRQGTYDGTGEGVLDLEVDLTVGELEVTRG